MTRFINPLYVNNLIDANIVQHIAVGSWEPIRQILELKSADEIQLIMPHSVYRELLSQTTPADVRAAAQDLILTVPVELTLQERIVRDRLLEHSRGNARLKNIEADLSHVAEAAKYGGYFITLDKRLLKRSSVISEVFGNIEVVTPEGFLEKVAEANKIGSELQSMSYEKRDKVMNDINSIFKKLEEKGGAKDVRKAIADLIISRLKNLKHCLDYWEKFHFAYAIAILRTSWLRLSIIALEKVSIPATERNENYVPRDKSIDSLTYEQVMEEVESIKKSCL